MSEVVPIETPAESHVLADSTPEGVEAQPATPGTDEATWKARLRGKDQALTQTQRERDELKSQLENLAKWKAEREQAEMTEAQRLAARVQELEAEASAAKAQAAAATLARQYPRAAELLGDDLAKFDPARVAEIDGRLAKEEAEAPEPRVDANSPRRTPPARPAADDLKTAREALVAMGNPLLNDEWK